MSSSTEPPSLAALIPAVARRWPEGRGYEWFQVSPEEEAVFGIAVDRVAVMAAAWGAYEAFKDMVSGSLWDMQHQPSIDAAKTERSDIAGDLGQIGWHDFAKAFSDLTEREAWQWWAKHEAWLGRNGILNFKDGS